MTRLATFTLLATLALLVSAICVYALLRGGTSPQCHPRDAYPDFV